MNVTQHSLSGAADILKSAANTGSVPEVDAGLMASLDAAVSLHTWLSLGLDVVYEWLLSKLPFFQDALDSLVGDSAAIRDATSHIKYSGSSVGDKSQDIEAIAKAALGSWQGTAANNFSATMANTCDVMVSYQQLTEALAGAEILLAEYVVTTKEAITSIASNMLTELTVTAVAALTAAPVTFGTVLAAFFSWAAGYIYRNAKLIYDLMMDLIERAGALVGQISSIGDALARATNTLMRGQIDLADAVPAAPGTPGDSYKGAAPRESDCDLAQLVYNFSDRDTPNPASALPPGYSKVSDAELKTLGIDPGLLVDESSGFESAIYCNEDGAYFVVFAGTDFSQANDVMEDAIGGATVSPQTEHVLALTEAIEASPAGGDNFVYLGHSLGGRLAAEASMATGNAAVIWNAAGVSQASINYIANSNSMSPEQLMSNVNAGQVRHYSTSNDLLTQLQQRTPGVEYVMPDAVGSYIQLGGEYSLNPTEIFDGHLMPNVREQMDKYFSR